MRVTIGGTAGRDEWAPHLTAQLFHQSMVRPAVLFLDRLKTPGESVHLLSGGCAWADHVAVELFNQGKAGKLNLYVTAPWLADRGMFDPSTVEGRSMNAGHRAFSLRTGRSSLAEVATAIQRGAAVVVCPRVYDRNIEMSKTDALFMVSWSAFEDRPDHGGTLITWNLVNPLSVREKSHVQLVPPG
jgi:hypothetical protein